MQSEVLQNYQVLSDWSAMFVIERIKAAKPSASKPFVLGLPTGSTPLGLYKKLIEYYQKGEVSFAHVITFNMDEYIGLSKQHKESYYHFMYVNLFNHIDIKNENIHILNGMCEDPNSECDEYEAKIAAVGGIDLFLGGIGHNGHLAFNEPGAGFDSRTRVVDLSERSIAANSRFFDDDINKVPTKALTVGIATVLAAKEVLILAYGAGKAEAVKKAVIGPISNDWPISHILSHKNVTVACDKEAAINL